MSPWINSNSCRIVKKLPKTNACRLLDKAGVKYSLVPYEVDPDDLAAEHVARKIGEDPSTVYKTLVLRGDRTGHFVCVAPADKEVDLRRAAAVSGNKKAEMLPLRDLLPTVGYIRGATTAIAMKKPFPVFLQQEAAELPVFFVSAGQRGLQLRIAPADYIAFTEATVADFVQK